MKIANYRTAETKEERLEFIKDFIEFFIQEYDSEKQTHIDSSKRSTHIAILPMDEHCVIFKAMSKICDDYYFHDIKSYINVNNNVLHLSETNGNTVKMNYNYLIQNVLSWNGVEDKFQQFLFNRTLSRFQTKAPTRQKTVKI
ncbi:TPA: hypothetical protein MYP09_001435 [Citrobacter farmeri]|nr:hypothetical protein [Citrobacter farmeri]